MRRPGRSWPMKSQMTAELVTDALMMALWRRGDCRDNAAWRVSFPARRLSTFIDEYTGTGKKLEIMCLIISNAIIIPGDDIRLWDIQVR